MKSRLITGTALLTALGTMVGVSSAEQTNTDMRDGMRPIMTDGAPVSPSSGEHNLNASFLARVSNDQRISLPHPPFDEIPEMPMPMPEAPGVQPVGNGLGSGLTFYDSATGETYQIDPALPSESLGGQSVEGDYPGFNNRIDSDIENGRSFGSMSLAGGLDSFPRSGNVKLVMRFTDINGNFRWFACSGSMQDPGVVLTAAHCVYNRDSDIDDWADIVYVYPGWDGDNNNGPFGSPDSDEVIQNFGAAYGTAFLAGTDYLNNGDFDADCGLIRLTRGGSRNVGALTGYYSWAWGFGCGTIQSRIYNNFSYPSENCPTFGLHNGRDMYFWSGSIDSCPGNQLQLDTGGNCLDTVWGGMSGSGMYYIEDGNRYMHGVCSNSNRNDIGRYTKLWEGFTNSITSFENTTRGNTFDLEALQVRAVGSTTVLQGQAMDDIATVSIVNATNANPATDSYTVRVYLSTNNNISSADTLLATWVYTVDFAAMQTRTFNIPAPVIPLDTPPGDYWLGVEIDSGTDSWSNNNDSDTWDAQQITVEEAFADLEATLADVNPGTYYQGESISVTHRTWNYGDRPADDTRLEFRASTNNFISTSDWFMEERNYGTLNVGSSIFVVSNVQIPTNLPVGNYYIGTLVETSDSELSTLNNWVADTHTITVIECVPDLTGDGQVNFFDVSAFLSAYNSMNPIADFDNNGVFNFFDVSAFLSAYNTGCP
ncbi:MAG: GC-type dockerin domain-anchored protein [Phycisphaerales bacterium]